MLFLIKWTVSTENRVACWNAFGNMTPEDDIRETGEHIKVIGRWHKIGGSGGMCVAESSDLESLNTWMLNWSPICNINIEPIVDDASARASIQSKPYFTAKSK
jgi:hypothetical protein